MSFVLKTLRRSILVFCLGAGLGAVPVEADGPAVVWQEVADPSAPALSTEEGHVWLRWTTDGDAPVERFELERRSPGLEPVTRRFSAPATFITGLPEGLTKIRVRALHDEGNGPWSTPLEVQVEYPSWSLVRGLSLLGTALFFATASLVLVGHRRHAGAWRKPDHD